MATVVEFNYLKDTKNTYRYQEEVEEDHSPTIGQMYVSKAVFPDGAPARIRITVERIA